MVDGSALYLWAPGEQPWTDTRVRFEFLSVISGRIEAGVWSRFDAKPNDSAAWMPGDEPVEEHSQWRVAPVPVDEDGSDALGDTGEFEVALLNAKLDGVTFLPGADESEKTYGSWLVAPDVRA